MPRRSTIRLASIGLASSMVTAALVTGFAPTATAAVIGTMTLSPTSGDNFTAFSATTSQGCPAPATTFQARISAGPVGSGITFPVATNGAFSLASVGSAGGNAAGFTFPVGSTLETVRQDASVGSLPVGDYTLEGFCRTTGSSASLGEFTATIRVTTAITASGGAWTFVAPVGPAADTTTTLTASPVGTANAGANVTLTATVANTTAPATKPTGTVQFKDGDTNLGDPVSVTDGVATKSLTTLEAGARSLTAVYVPAVAAFNASTSSALNYVVSAGVIGTMALRPVLSAFPATSNTAFEATTNTSCPTGASHFQARFISGPEASGITFPVITNGPAALTSVAATPGSGEPFTFAVGSTLEVVRQDAGVSSLPVGDYVLEAFCRTRTSSVSFGSFTAKVRVITPITSSGGSWTFVAPTDATTTALTASPVGTAAFGANVTLTATVANTEKPGTIPTGTVQFKDGATNLGAVVALVNGVATKPLNTLAVGARSLTAVYVPAAGFDASTSAAVGYTITAVIPVNTASPRITGTAKVGSTLTCSNGTWTPAGATFTRVWTRNGANISGAAATTYKLTVSDYTKSVACKVTAKFGTSTASKSSASVKVAAGAAPTARVRAKIVGSVKVGTTLRASASWSPSASYALTYVWKLNGKVISTKSTYKPARSAKGKSLTVTITAKRTGYAAGTSTSLAARVK